MLEDNRMDDEKVRQENDRYVEALLSSVCLMVK